MNSRSQLPTGLHSVPGPGGAHPVFSSLIADFADGQLAAIRLDAAAQVDSARRYMAVRREHDYCDESEYLTADAERVARRDADMFGGTLRREFSPVRQNPDKCPSYGCDAVLGPDSGIIDGDRYCAGCCANEAEVAGREERLQDTELRARGIF